MPRLKPVLQHQIESIADEIQRLAGEKFDIDCDKQLLAILKDKMGLPISQIDDESLAKLDDDTYTIPHLVVNYRKLKLLVSETR